MAFIMPAQKIYNILQRRLRVQWLSIAGADILQRFEQFFALSPLKSYWPHDRSASAALVLLAVF